MIAESAAAGEVRGAALLSTGRALTWGDGLQEWVVPALRSHPLGPVPDGGFAEGGCALPDGEALLQQAREPGQLFRIRPGRRVRTLDTGSDFTDCLGTSLNGQSGVLLIQRGMQARFYPSHGRGRRWPYRELYAIYTPSRQAGLLRHDVDGDGRADILLGNYWLRQPQQAQQPWELFAVNTYFETADSATLRLALVRDSAGRTAVAAAEGKREQGRVAVFRPPSDPTQLWREQPLAQQLRLRYPRGLCSADWNGDGLTDLAVAENAGRDSRVVVLWQRPDGEFQPQQIAVGPAVHTLLTAGTRYLIAAGGAAVRSWRFDPDQRRR